MRFDNILSAQKRLNTWTPFWLAATLFFIPISSSVKSITVAIALLLLALTPRVLYELKALFKTTWCKSIVLLFLIAVTGCFWGPANINEKFLVIGKYTKLLFIPLLAIGFKDERTRIMGISAFLCAMTLTCLISFGKYIGFFHFINNDPGHVFRNHIMTSFMMSFAAYLSLLFALRGNGVVRSMYGALAMLFSFQILFINTGRAGYIIYISMIGLLILQFLDWKQVIAAIFIGASTLFLVFGMSNTMRVGINKAISDYKSYQQNDMDTSIGYRLQFHDFAKKLFVKHPIIGNGTASFTASYRIDKPVASWTRTLLEPHNNYWLIASEYGLVGIFSLIFFFASMLIEAFKLQHMKPIALAMIIPFMIGNLSDSLLFYSGTGYMFILFMAICLGESILNTRKIDV